MKIMRNSMDGTTKKTLSIKRLLIKIGIWAFLLLLVAAIPVTVAIVTKERFSEGERIGTVVKFSESGYIWDSWDGQLNITQTGMNTSGEPWAFSIDNDDKKNQDRFIAILTDAQRYGWKVKIKYHEVSGLRNMFKNRGETDYFVDDVIIIDKNFSTPLKATNIKPETNNNQYGKAIKIKEILYITETNDTLKEIRN